MNLGDKPPGKREFTYELPPRYGEPDPFRRSAPKPDPRPHCYECPAREWEPTRGEFGACGLTSETTDGSDRCALACGGGPGQLVEPLCSCKQTARVIDQTK